VKSELEKVKRKGRKRQRKLERLTKKKRRNTKPRQEGAKRYGEEENTQIKRSIK
jgi:hypothetical protein